MDALAGFIRDRRNQLGITQAALADLADVRRDLIAQIESGKSKLPQPDNRRRLAKALGVSHVELLIAAGELTRDETARERHRLGAQREEVIRVMNRAKMLWMSGTDDLTTWQAQEREFNRQLSELDRAMRDLPAEPDYTKMAESHGFLDELPVEDLPYLDTELLRELIARLGVIVVTADGVRIDYHPEFRSFIKSSTVAP